MTIWLARYSGSRYLALWLRDNAQDEQTRAALRLRQTQRWTNDQRRLDWCRGIIRFWAYPRTPTTPVAIRYQPYKLRIEYRR